MACRDRVMPRNGGVKSLQLGHPQTGLGDGSGGNFPEKFEVVGVPLFKNGHRSGCPDKINASGWCVILKIVSAADAVQALHHLACLRINDCEPARLVLVPAANVSGM